MGCLPDSDRPDGKLPPDVGLCLDCCFSQRIRSARGSSFYLCELSRVDPAFPKYPRLPVLDCAGYLPNGPRR